MPGIGSILKFLKYAPVVYEVVKQAREYGATARQNRQTEAELDEVANRLAALEEELEYLRHRQQDVTHALEKLQLLVYVAGGLLLAAVIVLLILVIVWH